MKNINLVVISYKNKILLSCADSLIEENIWGLIGVGSTASKSSVKNAIKSVKKMTNLESLSAVKVSLSDKEDEFIYHIKLDDNNVNSMTRNEGRRLEFYNLNELEKLNLTSNTQILLSNYKSKIIQLIEA